MSFCYEYFLHNEAHSLTSVGGEEREGGGGDGRKGRDEFAE